MSPFMYKAYVRRQNMEACPHCWRDIDILENNSERAIRLVSELKNLLHNEPNVQVYLHKTWH